MLITVRKVISPLSYLSKTACRTLSTSVVAKEDKIKIKDGVINYVKVGNGAHHALFLPGALGTIWTEGKPQIEGFNRDKFTLVVWDPPGYGKSRPPEKVFSTDFYERDADAAYEFMKALKIPKYSLLGFSDGGVTSLIHAAKYPDAVNKLVVWGANSFVLPNEVEMYKKIRDINSWSKRMREPLIEIYGEELFAKYWAEWVDGMEALYKTKDGNICAEMLKNIKCPTFILYGQKDPLVDSVHASHLHTHIDGSRIHLYPEGKHHVHLKYAEDFNQRVQEFLLKP
ncbi:valacyclovir hydrolase [Spodoptera frugiperda]|uniref:Valacyclovir hydrolase n=1 Tax=Spodoptera frugiperda TaxID=7108 RepID=A0A9R0D573_SPOFR|nr:valacyclovir hydrolase [Spodoptera frugiperda]